LILKFHYVLKDLSNSLFTAWQCNHGGHRGFTQRTRRKSRALCVSSQCTWFSFCFMYFVVHPCSIKFRTIKWVTQPKMIVVI